MLVVYNCLLTYSMYRATAASAIEQFPRPIEQFSQPLLVEFVQVLTIKLHSGTSVEWTLRDPEILRQ